MIFVLFIVVNLLLMAALFAFGVYQFMQVEEKRKRRRLLTDAGIDAAELQALLDADKQVEARDRLMSAADVDRFSAESALAQLGGSSVSKELQRRAGGLPLHTNHQRKGGRLGSWHRR